MNEFSLINLEVNISVSQKNGDKLHLSWVEWVFVKTLRKHVVEFFEHPPPPMLTITLKVLCSSVDNWLTPPPCPNYARYRANTKNNFTA